MNYKAKVAGEMAWADIPPCPEQGLNVTYQMLRGMFMPGKVTPDQQQFYVDLFSKVTETPEWKEYRGAQCVPRLPVRQGVRRLPHRRRGEAQGS